tara:strand:- start:1151 stop:1675 length:525 start_codon:yes stop_codon:yes gene_type:complete
MPNEAQKFWNFSLELYEKEGVAAACLELQDVYQLDVNLLLFCFWHASAFGQVDQDLMDKIIEFSIEWRAHVVQPLRSARSWMKLSPNPSEQFTKLRERIKTEELEAERYQQIRIANLTSDYNANGQCRCGNGDSQINIESLLEALGIARDEKITSRLKIIHSALGGSPLQDIES